MYDVKTTVCKSVSTLGDIPNKDHCPCSPLLLGLSYEKHWAVIHTNIKGFSRGLGGRHRPPTPRNKKIQAEGRLSVDTHTVTQE